MNPFRSQDQFCAPNHDPFCAIDHLVLRYAFLQKGFDAIPDTHFWHVLSDGPHKWSTLSMQGVRDWKLAGAR